MTIQEKEKLADLQTKVSSIETKIDSLPDEFIKRLDDRYLQKDTFAACQLSLDEKYPTRKEFKSVSWVLSLGLTLIGIISGIAVFVAK
jgi:preprotein translocase subunit Sss1